MLALVIEYANQFISPQSLLEVLPKGSRYLFESTLVNERNRWAILGYSSASIFTSKDGRSFLDKQEQEGNPFDILSKLIADAHTVSHGQSPIPFQGGWLGAVSYEAARFLEKVPTHESDFAFDLAFYFVDSFFLFDLLEERLCLVSSSGKIPELRYYLDLGHSNTTVMDLGIPRYISTSPSLRSGSARHDAKRTQETTYKHVTSSAVKRSREVSAYHRSTERKEDGSLQIGTSSFSQAEYLETIEKVQNYIRDGHSYQVNLSQRFALDNHVEPFEVYKTLARLSPVPFAGFFEWEGDTILSGSPERLFEIKGRSISTRPIAGTRRCGNAEETKRFIQELIRDPKEHAEHAMLVDLARNDLGRICKHGTVHIRQFMEIVPYNTVIHTESEIEGTLLEALSFTEIMRALFPGGTITGVPKIRTMEIIHELEPCARGIYTGSLGYWSVCGHADFNIMIRPILCLRGKAYTHAGGGITSKSQAHREYKETLHKARAQLMAIQEANGV